MRHAACLAAIFLFASTANAAGPGVLGDWREPGGAVIHISACGQHICATLTAIAADAPGQFDIKNPDPAQRNRPLCGLVIGRDFHLEGSDHAEEGTLYDPKSGKTYHGQMTAHGNALDLRGYVGLKIFGRTETWTRTSPAKPCSPP